MLRAFGLREGEPITPLPGAISQTAWRVGDAVVKRAQDPAENEWSAAVFAAIEEDGFRVHRPIATSDGAYLVEDWLAWRWIEGEHERHRWHDVIAATRALHRAIPSAAARAGRDLRPAWLATRTHRWAVAERVVWHGDSLPSKAIYEVAEFAQYERAAALGPPLTDAEAARSQVVHGDAGGNVLVDPAFASLAFIDMSPGWRPAASVEAQIAVEAVAWRGADESLLDGLPPEAMARACAWRFLCGFQALAAGGQFNEWEVERFTRVLDVIGA